MANAKLLTRKTWNYKNSNKILSTHMGFSANGEIFGYLHPNERRWRIEHGKVVLLNADGKPTCILHDTSNAEAHQFSGRTLVGDGRTVHTIYRKRPTVGVFLRTHFWDAGVEEAFRAIRRNWTGDLFVCADETHKPKGLPEDRTIFWHSEDSLQARGLPPRFREGSMIWYNGDYAIYDVTLSTNYDYYVLIEYDCFVNRDLNKLVRTFIEHDADFVAPFTHGADNQGWYWEGEQRDNDEIDYGKRDLHIYKSFFPFIFISREAALHLYARRLAAAHLRRSKGANRWPFCESFVPTELVRADFVVKSLQDFTGPLKQMTVSNAWSWREVHEDGRDVAFVHPVLYEERLIGKLVAFAGEQTKRTGGSVLAWLEAAGRRKFSDSEQRLLEKKIEEIVQRGS